MNTTKTGVHLCSPYKEILSGNANICNIAESWQLGLQVLENYIYTSPETQEKLYKDISWEYYVMIMHAAIWTPTQAPPQHRNKMPAALEMEWNFHQLQHSNEQNKHKFLMEIANWNA